MSTTYNGHRNWAQWNVSLWINNDEGLYTTARYYARSCRNRDVAAQRMLDSLHQAGFDATPDGARYSKTAIRAAMVGII